MKMPFGAAGSKGLALPAGQLGKLGQLALGPRWRALQRRFDQCAPRERLLLIGAAAALVFMAADALWLGPALSVWRAAQRQQQASSAALQALQDETRTLTERGSSQLRQQQTELAHWRQRVRDGDQALRQHEDALVGSDQMLDLLGQLLRRHGEVRVRAMTSLGRTDLLAASPTLSPTDSGTKPDAATAAPPGTPPAPPSLYRHGVELVLEGGFADLLQTLQALEALPQRVLWGSLSLKVEQHPKSVLTLKVYTISRDRHWLEL